MRRAAYLFIVMVVLFAASRVEAIGILLPKDGGLAPLAIKYHRVTVKIKDGTAVTDVKQSFQNNTRRVLEGTFYFPLPKGATISDFALYMNGKRISGSVLERGKARRIYESIVRRMKDPGLIEYIGNQLFKARIYPIPANGEMKVDISFNQVLPFNDGVYRYVYPMKTPGSTVSTLKDFTLVTNINSKIPIKTVYSPSHKVFVKKKSDSLAHASFEESRLAFTKDFVLYYTVSKKSIGLNLLTYRPKGEPGYYLLMASPKSKLRDKEIIGKGIVFVVDTSGSMSGEKMKRAKAALKYCLNKLNPKDWFNIVRFSSDVEKFEKWQVPANKHNVKRALKFVDQLEAGGATAFSEALAKALMVKGDRPHLIMFLTDGRPTIGETRESEIVATATKHNKVKANIFFFGIGDDINAHLLDRIATTNRGFSTYLKPNQDIEHKIASFYNRISYPVMTDLKLEFGKIKTYAMVPFQVPDLFKGSQIILMGRYRNSGHSSIVLKGKVSGQSKTFTYEGVFPEKSGGNEFIAKLWAHRQVGFLLNQIRLKGESHELKKEVIQLAKRFGIVTPYTSYLVVEPTKTVVRGPGRRILLRRGNEGRITLSQPSVRPMDKEDDRSKFNLKTKSGKKGVRIAKNLQRLKDTTVLKPTEHRQRTRFISGRSFELKAGVWTDSRYKSSLNKLSIKYMSSAWFNLLKVAPELKAALQLGSRVTIVVGKTAIVVDSSGSADLSEAQLRAKLR